MLIYCPVTMNWNRLTLQTLSNIFGKKSRNRKSRKSMSDSLLQRSGSTLICSQLDASVLREFVEKIYISEVYTPDENKPRIKVREIEIVYNFIGAFDFEDAREQSQAAQKEKKTGVA